MGDRFEWDCSAVDVEALIRRIRSGTRTFVLNDFVFSAQGAKRGLRVLAASERFVLMARSEQNYVGLILRG